MIKKEQKLNRYSQEIKENYEYKKEQEKISQ